MRQKEKESKKNKCIETQIINLETIFNNSQYQYRDSTKILYEIIFHT